MLLSFYFYLQNYQAAIRRGDWELAGFCRRSGTSRNALTY
jgi:hypothetical protein